MSVVWKRDGKRETNGMSLREVAGNLRLCYAGYDMASGTWQNAAVADQDESILIGDAAVLCISLIFAAISAAVLENERRRVRES